MQIYKAATATGDLTHAITSEALAKRPKLRRTLCGHRAYVSAPFTKFDLSYLHSCDHCVEHVLRIIEAATDD